MGAFIVQSSLVADYRGLPYNAALRNEYLRRAVGSYEMAEYISSIDHGNVFQIGFEPLMYYLPANTYGDMVGHYRYYNIIGLAPGPLWQKMRSFNIDLILGSPPFYDPINTLHSNEFEKCFTVLKSAPGAVLYRVMPQGCQK